MKKLITMTLATLATLSIQAATTLRVDTDASKAKNTLNAASSATMKISSMSWVKEDMKKYTCIAVSKKRLGAEWMDFEYSIKPEKDGKITLSILGNWAKDPAMREWVLISKIEINGKLAENGDFKKLNEKNIPAGMVLDRKAAVLTGAAENGGNAVRINHDNRLEFTFAVKAGQSYIIKIRAKDAPAVKK